jgi:hypothetical protein
MRTFITIITILLALTGSILFFACEGTDTRKEVDKTVKTVVGKEQTDQFKKAKKKLGDIETQQSERYKDLEEEE